MASTVAKYFFRRSFSQPDSNALNLYLYVSLRILGLKWTLRYGKILEDTRRCGLAPREAVRPALVAGSDLWRRLYANRFPIGPVAAA